MAYPLTYGYSLVGKVVRVGPGVDEAAWMHRMVFAFAPHGSHALVSIQGAMIGGSILGCVGRRVVATVMFAVHVPVMQSAALVSRDVHPLQHAPR